jgi:hypothetical protein
MDEIINLMNEYMAIADKESLYARVLRSFIAEREQRMRKELERRLGATTRDPEHGARLRLFARTAPLERIVALYERARSEGVRQQREDMEQ